jgi:hypothetical protein
MEKEGKRKKESSFKMQKDGQKTPCLDRALSRHRTAKRSDLVSSLKFGGESALPIC